MFHYKYKSVAGTDLTYFPALANCFSDVLLSGIVAYRFQVPGVPLESATRSISDIAEQHRFCEWTRVVKITCCRFPTFARCDPLLVKSRRIGNRLFGCAKVRELFFGVEFVGSESAYQDTFCTDKDIVGTLEGEVPILQNLRAASSVIPM